jgi:TRAP-type C4-dicarboxylate transport system substrate-binding protein
MMMSALILGLSYEHCLKIFDDVWNKFPELWAGQWKDYKLLWITPIDPNLLVTAKQPVRKMEDIKGLQIRIPNAISADVIKQMLAVPVSMSSGDWIVSLDKGTTDGAAMSNGSLLDYKIGEKVRYVTYYSLGPGILFLTMNKDTWKDLSPEMQQVINNSAGWGRQHMIDCKRQSEKEAIDYLKSKGVEFIKLSADQFARWDATIKPVFDKMANDLNAKGFPGTALVTYALERAKYYSTQE